MSTAKARVTSGTGQENPMLAALENYRERLEALLQQELDGCQCDELLENVRDTLEQIRKLKASLMSDSDGGR